MANDNKKINELVENDDDDTSELEVLTATVVFDPDYDYASESDAATHSFETSARSVDGDGKSVAELKSDLQKREENISNLQYDIEELRARWTGLEKELKAREELTDNVTRELQQSNRKLAQTISLLKKRDSTITKLESALEEQSARLAEAESDVENARQDAGSLQADIEVLRQRNETAVSTIDALNAELVEENSKRQSAEEAERAQALRFEQLEEQYGESLSVVGTLQQYIEGRKSSWERQEADLRTSKRSLKAQRKENSRLAREAKRTAEQLRKEQAARQKLRNAHDNLQTELEKARDDAEALTASLAEAEVSQRTKDEQIASLAREIAIATPALEDAQAEHRRLATQLAESRERSNVLQGELAALQDAYAARESLSAEQQNELDQLTQRLAAATEAAAEEGRLREDLANQLQRLQEHADRLHREHSNLQAEATAKEELIAGQLQDIANLNLELESLSARFESEEARRHAAERRGEALEQEATRLHAELEPLRTAPGRLAALEKANAELSGLVSSNEEVIRDLRDRIAKTEGYADVLREKLQQEQTEVTALSSERAEARESLAEALQRIGDLTARFEAQEQRTATLELENEEAGRRLDEEVRKIRLELEAAEEALAESRTLNEQLTSDLLESTERRRALETQLAEADAVRDRDIRELSQQVAQLRQQLDDYERKIGNKDAAINALLTELAHKPESAEDDAAADDVVHRLADRKPQIGDERGGHPEKDRVTRLLIGSIEGQELRFPLFKDKLTIGRTVHNDIQLKAQYVSRRHAVVVTEDDRTRIVDWGSKNGIFVNGKRVSEIMLKNGDRVTVGTAEFRFEERPKR
jgi:chromosome segregation ATPase